MARIPFIKLPDFNPSELANEDFRRYLTEENRSIVYEKIKLRYSESIKGYFKYYGKMLLSAVIVSACAFGLAFAFGSIKADWAETVATIFSMIPFLGLLGIAFSLGFSTLALLVGVPNHNWELSKYLKKILKEKARSGAPSDKRKVN